jgi:hypothetical protein
MDDNKVIHLTLTGVNVGVVLCGFPYKVAGVEYAHAMYAPLDHPAICPECLAVWNDDSEDSE